MWIKFIVRDHVFLQVIPTMGLGRAIGSRKFHLNYWPISYFKLNWTNDLWDCHVSSVGQPAFGISRLSIKKICVCPCHVLEVDNVQVREDLIVEVQLFSIKDHWTKQLRDMRTSDSTWKLEKDIRNSYPYLFCGKSNFWGQTFLLLGRM